MKRSFWLLLAGKVGNELLASYYQLAAVILYANKGSSLSASQNEEQTHNPVTHNIFRLSQAFLRLLSCTIPICFGKSLVMRFKMGICSIYDYIVACFLLCGFVQFMLKEDFLRTEATSIDVESTTCHYVSFCLDKSTHGLK